MSALKTRLANLSRADRLVALAIFAIVPMVGTLLAIAYAAWRSAETFSPKSRAAMS